MTATLQRQAAPVAPAPPTRVPTGALANVAVGGLTLAAVTALSRLFVRPMHFFVPVAVVALVVHAGCWACRRFGIGLPLTALLAAASTALAASWLLFGSTTTYGIPGYDTVHSARLALSTASQVYRSVAAPAPVVPGFTLAGAFGAAVAAFLADWAAFRMRATVEACLPSFSLFVLSAALAQGRAQVTAGVVWLAALLCFLLVRNAAVDGASTAWFASRGGRGARAVLLSGLALGGCAVTVAAIFGPDLPGATVHPLINWRHRNTGDSSRTIGVSPLVDITARLQSQSHQEVFTVNATRPVYWRLTSLDHFDRNGWSLKNEFVPTGGRLAPSSGPSSGIHTQFRISALSSIWLPAAYRPTQIGGVGGVSFSPESGSLITDRATSNGLTYVVDSAVPAPTGDDLAAAPAVNPADPALARYLELPAQPAGVVAIANAVTKGARTPYAKARALQDWLRSAPFRYDLNVTPDDSPNALINFLTVTKAGFCQQFAASYAVLARILGLPTRVAVGFTPGQVGADGLYHVTDAQAHAWPEVYFPGVGWVAFEPTPGRGSPDPAAQAVTGVPPAQDTGATGVAGGPATTAPTAGTPTSAPARREAPGTGSPLPVVVAHHHTPWWRNRAAVFTFIVAASLAAWVGLLLVTTAILRGRRAARARRPGEIVALAWTEATEALTDAGLPPRRSETPLEFARRAAGTTLPGDEGRVLGQLARAVEVADYASDGASAETAASTSGAADRIRAALQADLPRWARVLGRLDPRATARLMTSELSRRRA